MTRICVSINELTLGSALAAARSAVEKGAELIEVRFDLMSELPNDLTEFTSINIPKIATLRASAQGGKYTGSEADRTTFLRKAIRAGFGYIDLEDDSELLLKAYETFEGASIIASHHDLERTPSASSMVETLVKEVARADVAKAAYMVSSVSDVLNLVQAGKTFSAAGREFALMGMGPTGEITRVCADRMGCAFAYAALEPGKEAAPGQLDLMTMKRLTGEKTIVGVVGASLSHSRSALMHNAAFEHLSVPGRYFKLETRPDELETLIELALELEMRGFNVTIPYKETIIPLLDSLDEVAKKVKAVNTVVIEDDELRGTNTDVYGVAKTLELAKVEIKGRKALVVGAGGASRACCAALSEGGASVHITNRTMSRAATLAKEFQAQTVELDKAPEMHFDIVMNCTPLGMTGYPEALSIGAEVFRPGQFVMDAIYNPPRTKFLEEAEKRGANTRNGEQMLVHQAAKAFELWTGKEAPVDVMMAALRRSLS